jgi:tRNA modification GTPase
MDMMLQNFDMPNKNPAQQLSRLLYLCSDMHTILTNPENTIVALATAQGVGALGIIRISGAKAFSICNNVFKGKDLHTAKSHTILYGHIADGDEIIDEVMLSVFRAPRSFTTEDSIEISCHGSSYIQQQIIRLLVRHGARIAEPGEFTLRAYIHGRIDLSQAEAVGDLIASQNHSQQQIAMSQMRGGLSADLKVLRDQLLNFVSLIELELDFGEEDVEFADRTQLKLKVQEILAYIHPIIESFQYGNAIKNGIPVAIIGRPNAGKSSLLNRLLNDERAIVSEIAGTTRDTIEEELHIKGVSFRFIDTAGIRATEDVIERIGIDKALRKIEEARIVIYIYDISGLAIDEVQLDLQMIREKNPTQHLLVLANKKDLLDAASLKDAETALSALTVAQGMSIATTDTDGKDIERLRETLSSMMQLGHVDGGQTIITNSRHYQALKEAKEALQTVNDTLDAQYSSDILALEIKRALEALGTITGEITSDEILGNIFGKFCIGK